MIFLLIKLSAACNDIVNLKYGNSLKSTDIFFINSVFMPVVANAYELFRNCLFFLLSLENLHSSLFDFANLKQVTWTWKL